MVYIHFFWVFPFNINALWLNNIYGIKVNFFPKYKRIQGIAYLFGALNKIMLNILNYMFTKNNHNALFKYQTVCKLVFGAGKLCKLRTWIATPLNCEYFKAN